MKVVSALVLKNGKVLLSLKKNRREWTLPGGKIEGTETEREALTREIKEELPEIKMQILSFFGNFSGITPFGKKEANVAVYLVRINGKLSSGAEIEKTEFFKTPINSSIKVSEITKEIIKCVNI
jgi:8-oxo-dGTP diphosphatase